MEGVLQEKGEGDGDDGPIHGTFDRDGRVKSAASLRHEVIERFERNSTFSLRGALAAIVAYLVLSVLAFRFILEPEWTIIDSCYFAVTTFTTNGKSPRRRKAQGGNEGFFIWAASFFTLLFFFSFFSPKCPPLPPPVQ